MDLGDVVVGFRPTDARIVPSAGSRCLRLRAQVRSIQPIGASVIIELVGLDENWSGLLEADWRTCSMTVDDEVVIEVDPAAIHLFDARRELRLN
jgi:ABC-type sugar transport system ATPase subunit